MKTNLERAKEIVKTIIDGSPYSSTSSELFEMEEEAKSLLEEIENGCDKKPVHKQFLWFYPKVVMCGKYSEEQKARGYCKDCQETLKILNDVLGEQDEQ